MRKFLINVNGNAYEVDVEEIGGAPVAAPVAAPVVAPVASPVAAAPVAAPAAAPAPAAAKPASVSGATNITCPMPGTILKVNVSVGQAVKKGDLLVVFEAMKMENEILAPVDGKIVGVSVSKGASVNSGDLLVSIA